MVSMLRIGSWLLKRRMVDVEETIGDVEEAIRNVADAPVDVEDAVSLRFTSILHGFR